MSHVFTPPAWRVLLSYSVLSCSLAAVLLSLNNLLGTSTQWYWALLPYPFSLTALLQRRSRQLKIVDNQVTQGAYVASVESVRNGRFSRSRLGDVYSTDSCEFHLSSFEFSRAQRDEVASILATHEGSLPNKQ